MRLDQLLVQTGHAPSRARAADMVRRGCVQVAGTPAKKPGANVPNDVALTVDDAASGYVSRAALKLTGALDATGWSVGGTTCLDLGASTGGFTQVLLERGARHVTALDVGHGQLVDELREDDRVTVLEHFNARNLTADELAAAPDFIVSDMSFVSLKIAAEPALRLAAAQARCVLLVKPQFEVGRAGIGSNGLVKDEALVPPMLDDMQAWLAALPGWSVHAMLPATLRGGTGNQEYLLCGTRHD